MISCQSPMDENIDLDKFDKDNLDKIHEDEASGKLPVVNAAISHRGRLKSRRQWGQIIIKTEDLEINEDNSKVSNDFPVSTQSSPAAETTKSKPEYWVDGKYVCHICDYDAGYYNNLYMHMSRKHPEPQESHSQSDLTSNNDSKEAYEFANQKMENFKFSGDDGTPYIIQVAKQNTPTTDKEIQQNTAKTTKWRNGKPEYWVDGKYICEICNVDTGYYNNFYLHMRRKHNQTISMRLRKKLEETNQSFSQSNIEVKEESKGRRRVSCGNCEMCER